MFCTRLAVLCLIMLADMFLLSFVGGLVIPYGQAEVFYTYNLQSQEYVSATQNDEFRYTAADGQEFGGALRAQFLLAQATGQESFEYRGSSYRLVEEGADFYSVYQGETLIGIAFQDVVNAAPGGQELSFTV